MLVSLCLLFVYLFVCLFFPAHQSQVRGVAIDGLNQQVMTAGADCKLKVCSWYNRKSSSILCVVVQFFE